MRVALFGGSFNPPHIVHQLAALCVLETREVDAVWLVPAFQHPFDKPLEPFADRFHMCELVVAALGPRVRVSDIEARLGGPSRTLRTVRKLMEEQPGVSFSLVIGSDLVSETESWYGSDELRSILPFIVVQRAVVRGAFAQSDVVGPSGAPNGNSQMHAPLSITMPALSSTEIRAALRAGRSVADVVPKTVLDYITSRGLYGLRPPS
jgi:nicotinate-nucleotide adenylyltransferase